MPVNSVHLHYQSNCNPTIKTSSYAKIYIAIKPIDATHRYIFTKSTLSLMLLKTIHNIQIFKTLRYNSNLKSLPIMNPLTATFSLKVNPIADSYESILNILR